jgi:hypothetical protein
MVAGRPWGYERALWNIVSQHCSTEPIRNYVNYPHPHSSHPDRLTASTMASTTYSSNSTHKDIPLERRRSTSSVDSDPVGVYFVRWKHSLCIGYDTDIKQHGPHDTTRHSRWPIFLRMRGSVVPAMILPLTFITIWSTCVTCIFKFVYHDSKSLVAAAILVTAQKQHRCHLIAS